MSAHETTYRRAYREAVTLARKLGHDVGIERGGPLDPGFRIFSLPSSQHRCGHELRCEVVKPTDPWV